MTNEAGNAGAGAGLTQQGKTDQPAGLTESEVVKGLNRKINEQNAELAEAKKGSAEAVALKAELTASKAELAKTKKLAQYGDVADLLEDSFGRGLDPDKVDDDFVGKIRAKVVRVDPDGGPAINPGRGATTPEQDAERLLRSVTSLI